MGVRGTHSLGIQFFFSFWCFVLVLWCFWLLSLWCFAQKTLLWGPLPEPPRLPRGSADPPTLHLPCVPESDRSEKKITTLYSKRSGNFPSPGFLGLLWNASSRKVPRRAVHVTCPPAVPPQQQPPRGPQAVTGVRLRRAVWDRDEQHRRLAWQLGGEDCAVEMLCL